jgi:hypothetical protein
MEPSEKKPGLDVPADQESHHHAGETSVVSNDAERKVLSKFDKFVMPQMALLVLFAYLDRTNIGEHLSQP